MSEEEIAKTDVDQLYIAAAVKNKNEAATVLLHSCMLQYGFSPEGVSEKDKYSVMPQDWNARGRFKIKYVHFCCPAFACCMTCVPLGNQMSIHGIVSDTECSESVTLHMKMNEFVKGCRNKASEAFYNRDGVSRNFKDNFSLPLLNLLHETCGIKRLYGFPGLCDDVLMQILLQLPVGGVLSMSAVNKNLYQLSKANALWKCLYEKDFSGGGIPDVDTAATSTTWKDLYKREYIKRRSRRERRIFVLPRQRLPQLYSVGPDYDTDLDIHFDPPFHGPALYHPFLPPNLPPHFFRR